MKDITRTEASGQSLQQTTDFISQIIQYSRDNHEKSICFVTGVPEAGKTLVGLNVAVQQFNQGDLAVYLSGNQPLVDVLTEALARDKKRQENEKNPEKHYTLTEARRNVKSFIQIVHHYRNTSLSKIKTPIRDGINVYMVRKPSDFEEVKALCKKYAHEAEEVLIEETVNLPPTWYEALCQRPLDIHILLIKIYQKK